INDMTSQTSATQNKPQSAITNRIVLRRDQGLSMRSKSGIFSSLCDISSGQSCSRTSFSDAAAMNSFDVCCIKPQRGWRKPIGIRVQFHGQFLTNNCYRDRLVMCPLAALQHSRQQTYVARVPTPPVAINCPLRPEYSKSGQRGAENLFGP